MNKYWMVHNASAGTSTEKVHLVKEEAITEAVRLAKRQPEHVFTVLEVVRAYKAHLNIDELPVTLP